MKVRKNLIIIFGVIIIGVIALLFVSFFSLKLTGSYKTAYNFIISSDEIASKYGDFSVGFFTTGYQEEKDAAITFSISGDKDSSKITVYMNYINNEWIIQSYETN